MTSSTRQNRLAGETSPYLLQHADNPVDWYPWCDTALERARAEDRPILLSIGYSACHWCHVMAHESFEDPETARIMNDAFINIKVDREERPDLDRIYQVAHQLLTQRPGGWPLTMVLNPHDQRPFFGGTYFPKEARYGMPAFRDVLARVAEHYAHYREDLERHGEQLKSVFERLEPAGRSAPDALDDKPLEDLANELARAFDREYGGIGTAPKFPQPVTLERMLRHRRVGDSAAAPDAELLPQVTLTLTRMAKGGIYDQLGGGFCRYAVDRQWQIPHFEKMLYDNGPLLALYARAGLATGDALFARIANETADWLLGVMQAPDGGFYASLDADSEGEEGRYYLWTREEVCALVGDDDYELVARRFGLDREPNFDGRWHLTVRRSLAELAAEIAASEEQVASRLARGRAALLDARRRRVAPGRDDKRLTSWNALAIRGLAVAARALGREDLTAAAQRAADFLRQRLVVDGRLRASYKDERARFPAYLDDHAFLLDALLELLQCAWRNTDLDFARRLAELLLERFQDHDNGGFWFTADDHEALMHRPKSLADEALPSGAGIAAFALQRLGFLLGEPRYLDAAERTLGNAWPLLVQFPGGHVSLLTALEEYLQHPEIVVLRGAGAELARWQDALARSYAPRRLVFAIDAAQPELPGALAERAALPARTVAYRCQGTHCAPPVDDLDALAAALHTH